MCYNGVMEEDNQEPTQNSEQNNQTNADRPHVRIFGANVDNGGQSHRPDRAGMSRDEWRAKKEEWKQKHREQKHQWRMQNRQNWAANHQGEGMFAGLVILFVGVMALLYTMGDISITFWHAIEPFWPILLILWGASILLGRHWFSRFVLFIFTLAFLVIVIFYGLIKTDSPLVSLLPTNVVSAMSNTHFQQ